MNYWGRLGMPRIRACIKGSRREEGEVRPRVCNRVCKGLRGEGEKEGIWGRDEGGRTGWKVWGGD